MQDMKYILVCSLTILVFFSSAQKGDEKILKQAVSKIKKGEFQKAQEALEKISINGKIQPEFIQIASLVYDSLNQYTEAISAYEVLAKGGQNNDAIAERIKFLKAELIKKEAADMLAAEKRKNCNKCKGTGYFETSEVCHTCGGNKKVTKDCLTCHGEGNIFCGGCEGTGRVKSNDSERSAATTCSRCNGRGYLNCTAMCTHGKVTEDCRKCNSTGFVTVKLKCDLH